MPEQKAKKIVNNLAKPGEGLSQRAVKSGVWVFALRMTERVFSLIRLIVLARILAPRDFGLIGIALLTMATLETFSQTGFQQALIQKKGDIESYLDAAWTVSILRGFLLFAILFFIAPYAAIFFEAGQAKPIIQVIGLSVLLQAFANIGVVYFQKDLEFSKQFLYQLSGTLADFIVAISAVLILRSIWALVFGLLAGNVARLITSYLIHPYRPRLSRDLGKAKELFRFGKWVLGSSIIIFLLHQGDDALVGKVLGMSALGFYQMAYRISNMSATEVTHVVSQVTFPAYSKLQDSLPKLREAYLKSLELIAFLSIPLAGMIFMLAPQFTKIFLGEKWMSMVPAMRVLCIFGVTRSINASLGSLIQGSGKPEINTKLSGIQLVIMAMIIYPLTIKWGIVGTCLSVVVPNLFWLVLGSIRGMKIINSSYINFPRALIPPTIGTIVMVVSILASKNLLWKQNSTVGFLAFIALGISIYLIIVYLLDKATNNKLRNIIIDVLKSIRGNKPGSCRNTSRED